MFDFCPYFVSKPYCIKRTLVLRGYFYFFLMNSLTTILWSDFSNILVTVCRFYQDKGEQQQISVASV